MEKSIEIETKEEKKAVTIYLSTIYANKLNKFSEITGWSRSEAIVQIIKKFLDDSSI